MSTHDHYQFGSLNADDLARTAASALQVLIETNPSVARGLVHQAALALPDPMRPTQSRIGRTTESPASFLQAETIEDISNWADLATQFELLTAAMASIQRMRPGLRKRFMREFQNEIA